MGDSVYVWGIAAVHRVARRLSSCRARAVLWLAAPRAMTIDIARHFEVTDQFPCPVIWLDLHQNILHLNPEAQRQLQDLSNGRGIGATASTIPLLWLRHELARFDQVFDLEYQFEKELISHNTARFFTVKVKRQRHSDGQPFATVVLLEDITPQKRFARALRQANQELEERVEKRTVELAETNASLRRYIQEWRATTKTLRQLSTAVEQSAEHILITDRNGVIEYVNPAFEALTGYSAAEAIGRTPRLLKSEFHPPEFFGDLWRRIQSGEVFRADFVNRKKNGEIYWEEKIISPIRDEQGNITHFVSTGRDITERRRSEADRADLVLHLQEAIRKCDPIRALTLCPSCRKVRLVTGQWSPFETVFPRHDTAEFERHLCPECRIEHPPDAPVST
ncbi:MAG: PAS domain S-box protein [Verrucomicrobiota bacterium]